MSFSNDLVTQILGKANTWTGNQIMRDNLLDLVNAGGKKINFDVTDITGDLIITFDDNTITNFGLITNTIITFLQALYDTGVTSSEFDYLDGVTSNIQSQIDDILDAIGVGSTNAQWITGVYVGNNIDWCDFNATELYIKNADGSDPNYLFYFPLPLDCGSYSLKIKTLLLQILDADVSNYVDRIYIYGVPSDYATSPTELDDSGALTLNSPQNHNDNLGAIDCTGYTGLVVVVSTITATASLLDIRPPSLEVFKS